MILNNKWDQDIYYRTIYSEKALSKPTKGGELKENISKNKVASSCHGCLEEHFSKTWLLIKFVK